MGHVEKLCRVQSAVFGDEDEESSLGITLRKYMIGHIVSLFDLKKKLKKKKQIANITTMSYIVS